MENKWIFPEVKEEIARITKAKEQRQEDDLRQQLMEKPINYVILDAALWEGEIDIAFKLCPIYTSLFATRGAEHNLDTVAPYLFPYTIDSEFSNWLKSKEEKGLRALYICSDESLESLRKHLRRFLRVKTSNGKWLFFRFYDPNVAVTTFQYLTIRQQNYFFSHIEYIQYYDPILKKNQTNVLIANEEKENTQLKMKFPVVILSNDQLRTIGISSFKRRTMLKLLNTNQTSRSITDLMTFVSDKTDQAIEYNIKDERIVFDYILLNLKHEKNINNDKIKESAHKLLSDKHLTQFEKLIRLRNLLLSN